MDDRRFISVFWLQPAAQQTQKSVKLIFKLPSLIIYDGAFFFDWLLHLLLLNLQPLLERILLSPALE